MTTELVNRADNDQRVTIDEPKYPILIGDFIRCEIATDAIDANIVGVVTDVVHLIEIGSSTRHDVEIHIDAETWDITNEHRHIGSTPKE